MLVLPSASSLIGLHATSLESEAEKRRASSSYPGRESQPTQGRLESAVLGIVLVVGPALMHLLLRRRQDPSDLLLDTLPLFSLPLLLIRFLIHHNSLWWIGTASPST